MTSHTLIIGGGVSGLSVAFELLARGERVTVLERGRVGAESSWAGGGILSPLLPWDYPEAVTTLALRSMAAYGDWVAGVEAASGVDTEFWRCGLLALGIADAGAALGWCATHGMPATRDCPPGSLAAIGCGMDSVWLPGIAQVRNPRLIEALRTAVSRLGGTVHEQCEANALETCGGRVAAVVQTSLGPIAADRVVLAAGAWSTLGIGQLAGMPQVRPIRGEMLLFKLPPGRLEAVVYRNRHYLIPRLDGHLLVGSTLEDAGFDKSFDDEAARALHAEAAALLPELSGQAPDRRWTGLRPGAPDNVPIIDRHPDYDNVFVNTGHFRYGVTMAPAAAELLADLMTGTTPALDTAPYRWQAALARRWRTGS